MNAYEILQVFILISVAWGFLYIRSYIIEKGKNLATHDDIAKITDKIEEVKHDYASKLESLKSTKQARLQIDHVRYQNEYSILTELSEKLVAIRDSAISLRPADDSYSPDESEEERKARRLRQFYDAAQKYYHLIATRRPFLPEEMYLGVDELRKKCWTEAIRFAHGTPDRDPLKYWDEATKSATEIEQLAESVMELIRTRIMKWELPT